MLLPTPDTRSSVTYLQLVESFNPLDADTFREFPHVSTFAMNYTPQLVGLMAAHGAGMLVGCREEVRRMVEEEEEDGEEEAEEGGDGGEGEGEQEGGQAGGWVGGEEQEEL